LNQYLKKTNLTLLSIFILPLINGCEIGSPPKSPPVSKSKSDTIKQLLPYNDKLQSRDMASVDLIVIHSTELPDLAMAREYGERIHYSSGTGNSGHYYIDRDGVVYQYVTDQRIAHHVGCCNDRSIGIEMINRGRYPDWYNTTSQTVTEPFTQTQINSVIGLVKRLSQQYPSITDIAGHSDLDTRMIAAEDDKDQQIRRKVDPGPLFPWDKVLRNLDSVVRMTHPTK
jgi:N-acetylmuramoyl-L-alanine amidase